MSVETERPTRQGTEPVEFRANIADRYDSLKMSGDGKQCTMTLEAYGLDAVRALVGLTKFTGRSFKITIEELTDAIWTKLDDETTRQGTERSAITVGRGRVRDRRDQ